MRLSTSILCSIITWPLYLISGAVLYIVGALLIPIAVYMEAYEWRPSKYYLKMIWAFKWPFMAPWTNEEDGLVPEEYELRYPSSSFQWLAIKWAAFRNPNSGLRWTPILSTLINPAQVQYWGNLGHVPPESYELKMPSFVYIWHGAYSGLWWHFKVPGFDTLFRFFIGVKLYAADCRPQNYGYRHYGTTFGLQAKRVQTGENKN